MQFISSELQFSIQFTTNWLQKTSHSSEAKNWNYHSVNYHSVTQDQGFKDQNRMKNLKIWEGRTRINKIWKISNQFGPVGPRTLDSCSRLKICLMSRQFRIQGESSAKRVLNHTESSVIHHSISWSYCIVDCHVNVRLVLLGSLMLIDHDSGYTKTRNFIFHPPQHFWCISV